MNVTEPVADAARPASYPGPKIRSALFEIAMEEPERAPRWSVQAVGALCLCLLVWISIAKLDIVAVAPGRLVPKTYVKIVQPKDSGVVQEILVSEGDHVEKGQVLVRLDRTRSAADVGALAHELAIQKLQLRRLDSELAGRPMELTESDDPQLAAQIRAQRDAHHREFMESVARESAALDRARNEQIAAQQLLEKLEKTLPSYQRSAEAFAQLADQKLVGALQADERKREALEKSQELEAQRATVAGREAAVNESTRRIEQLKGTYESGLHTDRVTTLTRISQLEGELVKAKFQEEHLELRAPEAGIVKELATTTIGAVVQPGTVLLKLVPAEEPLLAEVFVENKDIGFVRAGQVVRLKLSTYPFQKYGMLHGVVRTVSADSQFDTSADSGRLTPEEARSGAQPLSFKAVIELTNQQLEADGTSLPLGAGMQLSAEIVEGRRTVLEYLLSPLRRVASEAGQER